MISLFYPFVLLAGVALALLALVAGHRKTAAFFLLLALALNIYAQCIPLRIGGKSGTDAPDGFSVMIFNVHGSDESFARKELDIAALILNQNADFILLTEYHRGNCSDTLHNRIVAAGYECSARDMWSTGNAFYSRASQKQLAMKPLDSGFMGCVASIEASASGQRFDMHFCHLASNNYDTSSRNYSPPDNIRDLDGLKFYMHRIEAASEVRRQNVGELLERVKENDSPAIILGDMNDVCGSPAMNALRKHGFRDAWWAGGLGYGATIHAPLPFRIDHIMYNDGLELQNIKRVRAKGLSDHDALVARFSISGLHSGGVHRALPR